MSSHGFTVSILSHLAELRDRLVRGTIAVVITVVIALIFINQIFALLTFKSELTRPIFDYIVNTLHLTQPPVVQLYAIEMTETFGAYMIVGLVSGIILAIPYLIYELVMFIAPALTQKEKRYVYLLLPWVTLMLIVGVLFAYFILLPPAINFFFTFGKENVIFNIRIKDYIAFVTKLLLAVGLVFELPVVITFLAKIGVVSPKWLSQNRKWAIILAFVIGGLITPTPDPINQSLVSVPLYALYEVSIWLARLVYRKKKSPAPAAT